MQNILNTLYNALPRLKEIKDTAENTELIPNKNWDARVKSIFKSNLKKYGKATTPAGLEMYFHPCIITTHLAGNDTVLVEINREKYLLIRKYLMSEEFNK